MFLALVMLTTFCGCEKTDNPENSAPNVDSSAEEDETKSSSGPFGRYYYESLDGVYYEFDGEYDCYFVLESMNAKTSYLYVFDENATYEGAEGIFVIHISDINSDGAHKLVYDSIEDTIWDPDFGIFKKK